MDNKTTKVLLLDDDPNLRDVLSDILKVKGFEPIPAATGAAALVQIEQQDIDVALIDLMLEDMPGLEVLRRFKTLTPEIECIMLTGHASQATAIEAVNLGAYSYFQKPYDVDQLLVSIRRAAEKHASGHAIQKSEARFRSMIENSSDLICILNPDATLRYVSPSLERLLGYTKEDVVIGTGLQDYIHPEDISVFMEAFRQHLQTSTPPPAPMQLRIRHKDGMWHTLEGTGSNLLEHPAIEGIVINARDVTERKRVEEALQRSQEETAHANRLLLALSQAAQPVQRTHSTEEVYFAIQNQLTELGYFATGFELTEDGQHLSITSINYGADLVTKAEKTIGLSQREFQFPIKKDSIYHRVIYNNETVFVEDATRVVADTLPKKLHSLSKPMTDLFKLKHSIFSPLTVDEETIGILVVTGQNLSITDNPAITAFANQAAIAIQNARLFEQTQKEISERKQAEEALRQSTGLLGTIFTGLHTMVAYLDADFNFIQVNQAYASADDQTPDYFVGKNHFDLYPNPENETIFKRVVRSGKPYTAFAKPFEYAGHPERGISYWDWSVSPIKDEQGKVGNIILSLINVTARKQAEEALHESEESYRQLVERMPNGILIHVDGQIVFANSAGAKTLGPAAPEDLVGKRLLDFVHPDYQKIVKGRVKQITEKKKEVPLIEEKLIRLDGTVIDAEVTAIPFTYKNQNAVQVVFNDITERRQAEEARRQAEARYRSVVEQVPAIFYTETMDHKVIFVSSKIETLLGYTPEEWMSDHDFWKKSVHPDDLERVIAEDESSNQSGEPFYTEYRVFRKDGRMIWLRDQAALVKDSGKPIFWQGVMYDISAEKETEAALRTSEERYRMLAENMSDTIWLMDMSLRTTYISPSVTRLRGFTLEEINSIPLDQQMPSDSFQRILQLFAKILSPENLAQPDRFISRTIELEYFKKDGTKFWSENTFTLIRDPQGQPFAVLGSGRDISERKNAQEELQNSEKYFRALIENNTDAVVLIDTRGMILYESPAYARMMGRVPGQRLGKSGYEHIHADDKGSVAQILNELVRHPGETRRVTFRDQHKDGSWRCIEATGTNLLGETAVHGLVINMHDITERKQAEEEIRRRVADLEVLYENGLSISVLLNPREIAQKMIEILSKKMDWHHASIRLYNSETRYVELLALGKPGLDPDQSRAEIERLKKVFTPSNQGLSGWVIKHGKTVRSGDVHADKRYLSTFRDINSGLYVPLMIGERAIGCIAVESRKLNRFSEGDERLLQTLAAQSAIAFENARLYQDALGAAKRKAALHQGSLEIVRAGQEIEALCIALHHAVQQVMPAEEFTVSLVTEDGREVEAPYLYDRGIIHPNTRLPVEAGITGRVIKSKKPLRIKDVQKSRGAKPIMVGEMEPTRAVLSVPLLAQNEVIGVISAQSHDSDAYSVEDQIFMETLASEAAVAFENARLFEEIHRRLTELETLSQVSVSLTSAIDLQPLLENILAGARRAIPASEKGTIFLAEPDGKLRLHAVSGYTDPRLANLYLLPDQKGYASRVARERIPIKIDDAHAEYEIPDSGTIEEIDAVQSGIAAPLIVKGKVIGVISLDNASRKTAFTESDLRLLVTFASSAAVAIENARLFIETQQRLHRLSALHSIDATIGASVDTHVTLSIVLEHVMTELKADAAAVLLFNPLTRMLEYAAGRGFRVHAIEGSHIRLGEGLAGQTALQRRAIDIVDLQDTDEVEQVMVHSVSESASVLTQRLEGENFVSYHSIPLIAKGQVQGVLEIFRRTPMQVDQEWITFFEMLAGQTAIAIDNGRLFENLQQSNLELTLAYDATIQGWSQALELRDEETEGHTRRVTDLTLRLVQAMNVDEVEMEHVRRGALLHDIGKMAVPDSILLKAGPLDPNEWSVMRQHPQYAFNLLSPISYLRPAIHIPYCHHEKWDGSGYPRGLKGEEIPLVARIFAIVDVFDALTSNRPYRLAWTREDALTYIREQSGKHFDPKVVKTFMDLMAGEQ